MLALDIWHGRDSGGKKYHSRAHPDPDRSARRGSVRSFELVDSILAAKAADPAAKTSDDEAEIDRLVYELYGLTEKEVASIAGS